MTWPQLMGWLDEMGRQQGHAEPNPDSWDGAEREQFWVDAARRREERMRR